jgi:hypothetical protein
MFFFATKAQRRKVLFFLLVLLQSGKVFLKLVFNFLLGFVALFIRFATK